MTSINPHNSGAVGARRRRIGLCFDRCRWAVRAASAQDSLARERRLQSRLLPRPSADQSLPSLPMIRDLMDVILESPGIDEIQGPAFAGDFAESLKRMPRPDRALEAEVVHRAGGRCEYCHFPRPPLNCRFMLITSSPKNIAARRNRQTLHGPVSPAICERARILPALIH